MPLGVGRGQNVGLRDFCHILTLLTPGHPCFTDFCHILTLLPPGASVFHKHMSSFYKYLVLHYLVGDMVECHPEETL